MKKLLYILTLLFSTSNIYAQNAAVNTKLDVNPILIGEQANIELSIQYLSAKQSARPASTRP